MPGGGVHTPYSVVQIRGKWYVKNNLGELKNKDKPYSSREQAENFMRALYANVGGKALSK